MENSELPVDNALLLEAFNTFSEASLQLENAYNELKIHTQQLDCELKETNEKLHHSLVEQESISLHLRGILGALTSGIMVINLEGVVLDINPCAIKLLDIEKVEAHYTELGLPEPIEEFIYNCIESTMPRGPKKEVTLTRDGNQIDLELSFSLVRPEGGGILSVLLLINDKTLINRLLSQSKRNVRLAAMGEMAAELAHEIRNPLGSIKLFSSLLEKDPDDRPDQSKLAGQISHGVQILENIVSNMLAFSANVTPKRLPLSVANILEQSLPLFEMEMKRKNIILDFKPPSQALEILGDEHLLKQVILNLCNNAIKAMEESGRLAISVKSHEDYVEIIIKDNGCGIPESKLHKIFDPFFTTFQGGTGLGLSVVNQIIEKHRGAIDVRSKPGKGTTVILSLPGAS